MKDTDTGMDFSYKGSTRFSFESLINKAKPIGDDFVSKHIKEDASNEIPFPGAEQSWGKVVRKKDPYAYFGSLRQLDHIFDDALAADIIAFEDEMSDPETYAEYLGYLGLRTETQDKSDLNQDRMAASRKPRGGKLEESDAPRCFFLVYFPDKISRDSAMGMLKDRKLINPLQAYPFEELCADPDESRNEDYATVLEFSLPKRRNETDADVLSNASSIVEKYCRGTGYKRIVRY